MVDLAAAQAFVGRADELARLHRLLAAVRSGPARTIIVAGEAGIGKTRLVDRFLEEARADGVTALTGACLELDEAHLPFAPIVEALRRLLREVEPGALPALLGPGRRELVRILPELALRAEPDPAPPGELDRLAQARLFELLLGIVERLAGRGPVLLVVDDLQWADPSTLDLLRFLERGLRSAPVMFVFAVRTEDPDEPPRVSHFIAELERDGAARLALGRFQRDDLASLAAIIRGHPLQAADVARLLERTEGNPFFAAQLLAAGGWESEPGIGGLSSTLRDVLAARLDGLEGPIALVVRAASCVGPRFDDRLLDAAVELEPGQQADALRAAVERGILAAVEGPDGVEGYRFRHVLLRDVVRASLSPSERRDLHAAFARRIEQWRTSGEPPLGPETAPASLAFHYDGAADHAHALAAHVEAAEAAERAYAFDDMLRHLRRALDLWSIVSDPASVAGRDRAALLERAATAAICLGEHAEGVSLGRAAVAAVDPGADPMRAGQLHERLRLFLWEAGDRRAAAEAVAEAYRLIPDNPPSAARSRVLAHQAVLHLFAGDVGASMPLARTAVQMAREVGAPAELALALGVLGFDRALAGHVDEGLDSLREAIAIAERLNIPEGIALGLTNLVSMLDRVGRTGEALAEAERGLGILQRLGLERTYGGQLRASAGKALFSLGRWPDAAATLEAGLRLDPTGRAAIALHTVAGRLAAAQGHTEAARAHLADARRLDAAAGGTDQAGAVLAAVAEAATWRGRIDEVRAAVDAGHAVAGSGASSDPGLAWLAALGLRAEADAAALARATRDESLLSLALGRAARISERLPPRASLPAKLWAGRGQAILALCDAERARLEGTDSGDPTVWREAADRWAAIGRPFPAAYARYRLGEAILGLGGERESARAALAAARSSAVALGAHPLLEQIDRLAGLARLRIRPEEAEPDGTTRPAGSEPTVPAGLGLTPRELEVLRLVASGWSNQEIADALFITRKTASVHVSNILGKLGVGGRVEAAAIAHRLGVAGEAPPPRHVPGR